MIRRVEKYPQVARRVAQSLQAGIVRLKPNLRLGLQVPQAQNQWALEEMRNWVTGDCVARYPLLEEMVVILRIWHRRENRL